MFGVGSMFVCGRGCVLEDLGTSFEEVTGGTSLLGDANKTLLGKQGIIL